MHAHTQRHTYIHTYMHACIHAYMHTCIHTYIAYITYIHYMHYIHYRHYMQYIHYIHTTHSLHYITLRYVPLRYITYLHTLPTYYLRADGLLRSKHRRTSFRRVGWWRLGMLAQACGARKISRTLQDQSPTDCRAANISLHRFVALGGCAFRWCR